MSMFQQLLRIRQFREQRAQVALLAALQALQRATAVRDAASQTLDEFKVWAQAQEDALFVELLSRAVQVRDIQEVRHMVGEWRLKEQRYARDLERSEAERTKQVQALSEARARHAVIEKARLKITERVAVDRTQADVQREQAEELEMEEVVQLNHPGGSCDALEGARHE